MPFDINDPSTYPDDLDSLAALAEGGELPEAEAEEEDEPKAEAKDQEDPTPAVEKEPVEEKAGEEGKEQESAEAAKEDDEPSKDDAPTTIDGIPIQTADGKHFIPHNVLKSARAQKQAAEAAAAEARKEVERLTRELQTIQAARPTEQERKDPVLTDEEIKALEEQWGSDLSGVMQKVRDKLEATGTDNATATKLAALEEKLGAYEAERAKQRDDEAQSAIDTSPLLAAWQADEDSPYWDYATEMHRVLGKSDKYTSLTPAERFAMLVEKTEAVYGPSPHRALVDPPKPKEAVPEKPAPKKADVQAAAADKVAKAKDGLRDPTSLSDFNTGERDGDKSEVEKLDDMTPTELAVLFDKFESPDDISAFIAGAGL